MRKQIVITRVLEFGGVNTYLKTVIKYFGKENLIIILNSEEEQNNFRKIDPDHEIAIRVIPDLRDSINFSRNSFLYNLKEAFQFFLSLIKIFALSARNGFAGVLISAKDTEKYLYLFWLPFLRVKYVLHSDPIKLKNSFTPITCRLRLNNKKEIITVSNANRNSILSNWRISNHNEQNVHVVYNCLIDDKKQPASFEESATRKVVTMGHVVEYKNPYLWLDVARCVIAQRTNVVFYWLGNGPLLEYFQVQTKTEANINFVGVISDTDSFLQIAILYYQPSLIETQGIAVIEAMCHQLPCIVSDRGGLPESVVDKENGFIVKADNVKENVDRIIDLLDNPTLCKSFGQTSFKRYSDLFSFEKFEKEMDKIFKN